MTTVRAQVIIRRQNDLPIDHVTNTLFFDTDSPFTWVPQADEGLNETQLAKDLRDVFRARSYYPDGYGVEVKMYDMEDALPRRVKGHANWQTVTGIGTGAAGPREVAVCLSFRGAVNSARTRGRIFIGPWKTSVMDERPSEALRNNLLVLSDGIANLGGIDIDWGVRSATFGTQVPVKLAWVDDEWDTIRSRGFKPTGRVTRTHNE
jgi:hypothetical protein